MTVFRVVAGDELIQVFTSELVGLQREVLVGAQVVDPEGPGPGRFAGRFAIEKQDVGFDTLCVEYAGRQTRSRELHW